MLPEVWTSPVVRDENGLSVPGPHVPDTIRELVSDGPVSWFTWRRVPDEAGRIIYERVA